MINRSHKLLDDWAERYTRMLDGSALGYGNSTLTAFTRGGGRGIPGPRVPRGLDWPAEIDFIHRLLLGEDTSRRHRALLWCRYLAPGLSDVQRRALYKEVTGVEERGYHSDTHELHCIVEGALRARTIGI